MVEDIRPPSASCLPAAVSGGAAQPDAGLGAILAGVLDAVLTTDRLGNIQFMNAAAVRLFGWPSEAAVGLPISRLLPDSRFRATDGTPACPCTPCTGLLLTPNGRATSPCVQCGRLVQADPALQGKAMDAVARRIDGTQFPVEVCISGVGGTGPVMGTGKGTGTAPDPDEAGAAEPRWFVVAVRDSRVRRQTEEALTAARSQVELARRAKSDFLSTMSHELRTPLNGIIGFAEILRDGMFGPLPGRYAEYAGIIHESGQHLLGIINDLLDMARLDSGSYDLFEGQVEVEAVVGSCLALLRGRAAEKGVAIRTDLAAGGRLWADRRALMNILLNLISNGIKFTPPGGSVVITSGADSAGRFCITVVDTGIGIAPEEIPRIFKPFEQGESQMNRRHAGTGLGLAISKNLTELHGGSLELEAELGRGTRAILRLPADRILGDPRHDALATTAYCAA